VRMDFLRSTALLSSYRSLSANSLRGRKYSGLLVVADCRRAQSDLICDFGSPGHEDRDHFHAVASVKLPLFEQARGSKRLRCD
jgi:hypothetical protein